ncbi:MAG: hypothetical protein EOP24_41285 [Hyphomicrobiales bacterium]|nr:MAG: hypothetical protein EOP24_41285 [Hyphomicrobiales bacterium]
MGTDVYSSARVTITEAKATAPTFAGIIDRLLAIPEFDDVDTSGTPLDTASSALMAAMHETTDPEDIAKEGDQFVLSTSGWGRLWGMEKTLQVLADAGFVGELECEDEDGDRRRYRIDGAGIVHRDEGGPSTRAVRPRGCGVWIVQMQFPDDSDLDHVAVVGAERDAEPVLAAWARADARDLITRGELAASRIDLDVDDAALLDR